MVLPGYGNFTLATLINLIRQPQRLLVTSLLSVLFGTVAAETPLHRRVAITFDDLPIAESTGKSESMRRKITLGLVHALETHRVPATGFVNEEQININGKIDHEGVELLRMWPAAGLDLGNHSFSHPDLNDTPLEEFKANVLRGELVTRAVLGEYGKKPEFFRHPYLHAGENAGTRRDFEQFLAAHEYRIAPVTINNSDWMFARAYDLAARMSDDTLRLQIGAEYIDYMMKVFVYFEKQSLQLFDRNIDHVLLLHANQLNSEWFGILAERLDERGYEFITLSEALEDAAYDSANTYAGPLGISWLHRWAKTKRVDPILFRGKPDVPPHILALTESREDGYSDQGKQ